MQQLLLSTRLAASAPGRAAKAASPWRAAFVLAGALLAGLAAAPWAQAQSAAGAGSACSVRAQSTAIVVMICPKGFDADAIQAAATAACGARRVCNVWVWDAESKAPQKAPQRDADLDKAQAATAIAVWANDSKSLMRLQRVGAPK